MQTDLRFSFLKYFEKNNHTIVPSSSLIPADDPTILFANAGMNQFKDVFLGRETRDYNRATSVQKCVRAGGKHNDLDNVGFTARHLTFFEMMGNFSFGDYFKEEAISFAWEYLTKVVGLEANRLSATVHHTDKESKKIWMDKIGLAESRVTEMGDADNFWQMGDTGPCGPCSEIFFDRGPGFGGAADDRIIEVWNMVFMQFNRTEAGQLNKLAKVGVDTGMGYERLVAVVEGKEAVFQTSTFAPIISSIGNFVGKDYWKEDFKIQAAFNVLADHVRSASLVIADGGRPSNEGRGYVLRKIIRRALLFSKKLTQDPMLFTRVASQFVTDHTSIWPELGAAKTQINSILATETDKFFDSLVRGERLFESVASKSKDSGKISGQDAFKLYDTYGFPLEVTRVLASESGLGVDDTGFDKLMQDQRDRSGAKAKGNISLPELPEGLTNEFVGYEKMETKSKVLFASKPDGQSTWIALKESPFFVECGGQVSDTGTIEIDGQEIAVEKAAWISTGQETKATAVLVKSSGPIDNLVGKEVKAKVDAQKRFDAERNHTATHLLHAALQKVLGSHAKQAGSLVHPDYLRFLFNHEKALTQQEITEVEKIVNGWIGDAVQTEVFQTTLEEAKRLGAETIFGEKYNPGLVRVVCYDQFSKELCGGTHAKNTGRVGTFKIISETAVGTGVRAIIALTGPKCVEFFQSCHSVVKTVCTTLACKPEEALQGFEREQKKLQDSQKRVSSLQTQLASLMAQELVSRKTKTASGRDLVFSKITQDIPLLDLANFLSKKIDGIALVFTENSTQQKSSFVLQIGGEFGKNVDLESIAKELRKIGVTCGGKAFLQGTLDQNRITEIESFLINNN